MPTLTAISEARALSRTAAVLAVLLAAGSLLGGCGKDKKAEFSKGFKPVNSELLSLGGSVGSAVNGAAKTPDAVLAGEFLGFSARLLDVKHRLDALDPPGDLKGKTRTLSNAIGRLITDVREIGGAAREHRPSAARAATISLLRDSQSAGDARRAIAKETGATLGP